MKIVWTRKATRHLRASYDYWARESSPAAAGKMLDRIFSATELLERFPATGRRGRIAKTRELLVNPTPFLIVYRADASKIEVLALLHAARKWPDVL